MMSDNDGLNISIASLKEYLKNNSDDLPTELVLEWPYLSQAEKRIIRDLKRSCDRHDEDWREYEVSQYILDQAYHRGIKKAVRGDTGLANFITGRQDQYTDINGIFNVLRILDFFQNYPLCYIYARQGGGKTHLAVLLLETFDRLMEDNTYLGSNIPSLVKNHEKVIYVPSFTSENPKGEALSKKYDVDEWMGLEEFVNSRGKRIAVMDEAADFLTGYSSDAKDVEESFKGFSNKLRKKDTNLIFVSQAWKELHPQIRRRCFVIRKPSKQKADVYHNIDDAKKEENKKLQLEGIPDTSWEFDTKDEAEFVINTDLISDDLELEEEENQEEESSEVEKQRCKGTTSDGERCGTVSKYVAQEPAKGYCQWHEDQASEDDNENSNSDSREEAYLNHYS